MRVKRTDAGKTDRRAENKPTRKKRTDTGKTDRRGKNEKLTNRQGIRTNAKKLIDA